MEELLQIISQLSDIELQKVMRAVEKRYAYAYPEWDVFYVAVHKEPNMRKQDIDNILRLMDAEKRYASNGHKKKPRFALFQKSRKRNDTQVIP